MTEESVHKEIATLLEQLCRYWQSLDFAGVKSLWDTDDESPMYLAEEIEAPLLDWASLEAYWQNTAKMSKNFSMRTWDLRLKSLDDAHIVAWYRMAWGGDIEGYPKAIGGENRVSATLRRTSRGWRFCQYIEAPLAPLLYMQWLYELAGQPDR